LSARGAKAIILGCTEISLLVRPSDVAIPLLDTTALHAEAAAEFVLAAGGVGDGSHA
jgi:aspartate racemase